MERAIMAIPKCVIYSIFILFFALAGFGSDEDIAVGPEAVELREYVISWMNSIHSFNGSYTITFSWLSPHDSLSQQPPDITDVTYRFDGENRYMDVYRYEGGVRYQAAFFNDMFTRLQSHPTDVEGDYQHFGQHLKSNWKPPWPDTMLFPIETLFMKKPLFFRNSLENNLLVGKSEIRKEGNSTVLSHIHPSNGRFDIRLDALQRVELIERKNDLEWRFDLKGDNPFDINYPCESWKYDDYVWINDIWFPLQIECVTYEPGPEVGSIFQEYEKGNIPSIIQAVEMIDFHEFSRARIAFEKDSLLINEPLPESFFKIEMPENTVMYDANEQVIVSRTHSAFYLYILIFALLCFIALITSGFYFWKKHR